MSAPNRQPAGPMGAGMYVSVCQVEIVRLGSPRLYLGHIIMDVCKTNVRVWERGRADCFN